MKKLIFALLVTVSATAMAHEGIRHGGYYHGGCYGCGWVAPALIGGVIGYEIARPTVVVPPPAPVIVQQPQSIIVPSPAPVGYHWTQMINPQTNQYQLVLVPN